MVCLQIERGGGRRLPQKEILGRKQQRTVNQFHKTQETVIKKNNPDTNLAFRKLFVRLTLFQFLIYSCYNGKTDYSKLI